MGFLKMKNTWSLLFFILFGILLSAIMPLALSFHSCQIYPPYILCTLLFTILILLWLLTFRRVLKRKEEIAFIVAQMLIVIFPLIGINPITSLSGALPALYAATLYWATRYLIQLRKLNLSNLFFCVTFIFIVLTVVGLIQFITKNNIGVVSTYFGENIAQGVYETSKGGVRISGTFSNPNTFAQVYSIYASIMLIFLLFYRKKKIISAILFSGLISFIVLTSLSRSGLLFITTIQLALYSLWLFHEKKSRNEKILAIVFLLFGSIALIPIVVSFVNSGVIPGISRVSTIDSNNISYTSRTETYSAALQLLHDPLVLLTGVGDGNFYQSLRNHNIYVSYKSWLLQKNQSSVHNWILLFATEYGLIVLLLYIYAVSKTVSRGWSLLKSARGILPASLSLIITTLYLTAFQLTTSGKTIWLLTPVVIMLAWIQHEYDLFVSSTFDEKTKSQ